MATRGRTDAQSAAPGGRRPARPAEAPTATAGAGRAYYHTSAGIADDGRAIGPPARFVASGAADCATRQPTRTVPLPASQGALPARAFRGTARSG